MSFPASVKVTAKDNEVTVEGTKGKLTQKIHEALTVGVDQDAKKITVKRPSDEKHHKALHGLFRSLIANMVQGVTEGFSKGLEIHGMGYTAKVEGQTLALQVGFSHPVDVDIPDILEVEVISPANPARFTVRGPDKQLVGEFAARLRRIRPPEPYKGKGIRYADEVIRRKAGKALVSIG